MDFDLGGMGSAVMAWGGSMIFWGVLLLVFVIIGFGFLYMKKSFSYKFPVLEVIGIGNGKVMFQQGKAGWIKKNRMFFGLIELGGEQEMRLKKGDRKIQQVSSMDYHEIGGKRGLIVKRKDDDPAVLVALTKFEISNEGLLAEIAPADYRDAAIDILNEKRKETLTWWDENKSTLLLAGVIIFALISLIIIFNFAKGESTAWREAMTKVNQLPASGGAP